MAGFVPSPATPARPPAEPVHPHLVFVPVSGQLVFFVCLLLIAACFVWLSMLWRKGVQEDEQ